MITSGLEKTDLYLLKTTKFVNTIIKDSYFVHSVLMHSHTEIDGMLVEGC